MAYNVGSIFADLLLNFNPFTKGLAEADAKQARTFKGMDERVNASSKTIGGLKERLDMLNSRFERTAIGSRNFDILKQKIAETSKQLQNAQGGASGLNGILSKMGGVLAGAGITVGAAGLAKMGMELETTEVQFKIFLKSAEKAKQVIKDLNQFANETPFSNSEVLDSGKRLLAAGVAAEDLKDQLKMIGDIASGSKVPLNDLAAVFAKMKNTDIIQGEELNQLETYGPILKGLADNMNLSVAQLKQRASEGKVSFADLQKGMKSMTTQGGMFFGMMDAQAQTAAGKWSTMTGTIESVGMKIGYFVSEALKPLLDVGNAILGWIDDSVDGLKTLYQELGPNQQKILQITAVIVGLGIAAMVAGPQLLSMGNAGVQSIKSLYTAMMANPMIIPIMAAVAAIALMVVTFDRWKSVFDPVIIQGEKLKASLVPTLTKLDTLSKGLATQFDKLSKSFGGSNALKAIKDFDALTFLVRLLAANLALMANAAIGAFQLVVNIVALAGDGMNALTDAIIMVGEAVHTLFDDPLNIDAWLDLGDKFANKVKKNFAAIREDGAKLAGDMADFAMSQKDVVVSVFKKETVQRQTTETNTSGNKPLNSQVQGNIKELEEAQKKLVEEWKKANKETVKVIENAELMIRGNAVDAFLGIRKSISALGLGAEFKEQLQDIEKELIGSTEEIETRIRALWQGVFKDQSTKDALTSGMITALSADGEKRKEMMKNLFETEVKWKFDQSENGQKRAQFLQRVEAVTKDIHIKLKTDADVIDLENKIIKLTKSVADKTRLSISSLIGLDPKDVNSLNKIVDGILKLKSRILDIDKEIKELSARSTTSESDRLDVLIKIEQLSRERRLIEEGIEVVARDRNNRLSEESRLSEEILELQKKINAEKDPAKRAPLEEQKDSAEKKQRQNFESVMGDVTGGKSNQLEPAINMLDTLKAKLGSVEKANLSGMQEWTAYASGIADVISGAIQAVAGFAKQVADIMQKTVELAQEKFKRKFEVANWFGDLYAQLESKRMQEQIDAVRATEDAKIEEIRRGVEIRKALFDEEYQAGQDQLELQKQADLEALRISYEQHLLDLQTKSADKEQAMISDDLMDADYKGAKERLETEYLNKLADLAASINKKKEDDKGKSDKNITTLEEQKNAKLQLLEEQKAAKEKENKKALALLNWAYQSMTLEMGKRVQIMQLRISGITSAAQVFAGTLAALSMIPFVGPFIAPPIAIGLAGQVLANTQTAVSMAQSQFVMPPAELFLARGGVVKGPGGPTDDLISAKLSNREGVLDAGRTEKMISSVDNMARLADHADRITNNRGGDTIFHEGAIQFYGVGDMDESKMDMYSRMTAHRVDRYRGETA